MAVFALLRLWREQFPLDRLSVALPGGGIFVERFRQLGIAVEEFPLDTISLASMIAFPTLLSRLSPDVVHSHGKGAGFYARSRRPREGSSPRLVHSYHGFHPPTGRGRRFLYLNLEAFLLGRTSLVITVSRSEQEEVAKEFPSHAGKFRVVPNVVDPAELTARSRESLPPPLAEFLRRPSQEGFVVTMIARNDPAKNYPLALETLRLLLGEEANLSAVVIGAEGEYAPLRQLVSDFPARVFACPSLPNTAPLLASSGVLLMTSRKEGAPLVAMEAASLGVPVVGSDVDGIRDVVLDQSSGLLCSESSRLLADAVLRLRRDADLYRRLRDGALARSRAYDPRGWTARYRDVYAEKVPR